jgi:hypothetical protein
MRDFWTSILFPAKAAVYPNSLRLVKKKNTLAEKEAFFD